MNRFAICNLCFYERFSFDCLHKWLPFECLCKACLFSQLLFPCHDTKWACTLIVMASSRGPLVLSQLFCPVRMQNYAFPFCKLCNCSLSLRSKDEPMGTLDENVTFLSFFNSVQYLTFHSFTFALGPFFPRIIFCLPIIEFVFPFWIFFLNTF